MKQTFYFFLLLLLSYEAVAQSEIILSGRVFDAKKQAIIGASISIKDTYDGATTDIEGNFKFRTEVKGHQTLKISSIGYEPKSITIIIEAQDLTIEDIELKEQLNQLDAVVITGGSFNISESKRMMMLKPLDIVTTPGTKADIVAAIQMLPGNQKVGEKEGLFVRGGDSYEAKIFVDDVMMQTPFYSGTPDVAQRNRFSNSAFLFKGTSFSKGGYSAQYGQALSAILALQTQDSDPMPGLTVGLNLLGPSVTYSKTFGKFSVWQNTTYNNMDLFTKINPQNIKWNQTPNSLSNNFMLRYQLSQYSFLKVLGLLGINSSSISSKEEIPTRYDINNQNAFVSFVYQSAFGESQKWVLKLTGGYTNSIDKININAIKAKRTDGLTQAKAVISKSIGVLSSIWAGAEVQRFSYYNQYDGLSKKNDYVYQASFVEGEYYLSKKVATKIGIRQEYANSNQKNNISPRITLAYKINKTSQISGAFGYFYQLASNMYLFKDKTLDFERSMQLLVNYEYSKEGRSLRLEAFQKDYSQLVREHTESYIINPYRMPVGVLDNTGNGYSKGVDIFYRDTKTIKNGDFWISYSLVDGKRLYANMLEKATPTFLSKHNLNLLYKHNLSKNITLGATYSYASPRYYYSPNFKAAQTTDYQNLSLNINYLTSIGKNFTVLYANIDNALNRKNIFTYRFDANGNSTPVVPASLRSFFVGTSIHF